MTSAKEAAKGVTIAITLMVVAGFLPAIALGLIGWTNAVSITMLAGMGVATGAMMGKGWQTSVIITGPLAILAALTVWAAPYALLAALVMGLAAFLRGYGAKAGLHNALLTSTIALGFFVAQPPESDFDLPAPLFTGLFVLVAGLWVTLVVYLARAWVHPPALTPLPTPLVLTFSTVLAAMVAVATWCVVHFALGHAGAWIILTILVVYQPYLGAGFRKAGERAIGTVVGFVIAMAVGAVVSSGAWLYAIGTVFVIVSMALILLQKPYWIFAAFLTTAIVLLESAGSTVKHVDVVRLEATVVALVGVLVVMLALSPVARRFMSKAQAAGAGAPAATSSGAGERDGS